MMWRLKSVLTSLIFAVIGACAPTGFDRAGNGKKIAADTPVMVADGENQTLMEQVSIGQPLLNSNEMPAPFD
ncbi:MAG: hypothetical protein AAF870_07160 [Pseudomonadota bacterium]